MFVRAELCGFFVGQRKNSCVSRVRQEVCDRQHAQQSHQASPQVGVRAVQAGSIRLFYSFIYEMGYISIF
jgi:hypothetical protein